MADNLATEEQRLRRRARRLDLMLRKTRSTGTYFLVDPWRDAVVRPFNFDGHWGMTADEVRDYLET